jgi:hypothetical protein
MTAEAGTAMTARDVVGDFADRRVCGFCSDRAASLVDGVHGAGEIAAHEVLEHGTSDAARAVAGADYGD